MNASDQADENPAMRELAQDDIRQQLEAIIWSAMGQAHQTTLKPFGEDDDHNERLLNTSVDTILALFTDKLAGLLEHQTAYLDDNHSTKNPAIAIPVSAVERLLEELKS